MNYSAIFLTLLLLLSPAASAEEGFQAHSDRAQRLWADKEYEEALESINLSLDQNTEHYESFLIRGRILRSLGRLDEAERDIRIAGRMDRSDRDWVFWYYMQWVHVRNGENEKALEATEFAVARGPHQGGAYKCRGQAKFRLDDYEGALSDYTKYIALAPKSSWALHARGDTYARLKNYEKALEDYLACLTLDPEHYDIHVPTARMYLFLDRLEECDESARRQMVADRAHAEPSEPLAQRVNALCRMSRAYCFLGKDHAAVSLARKALSLRPKHTYATKCLAYSLVGAGSYREAREVCTELLSRRTDSSYVYLMRAKARENLGDIEGALRDRNRAAKIDPRYAVKWRSRTQPSSWF